MKRGGILDGLWWAWPVMNWILPVLFSVHGLFSTFGGWAWSFLLFSAPIVIPACGLLGMLPYRRLREQGHESAPWRVGALLLVNWWAAFAAILLAIDVLSRQSTESIPSLLRLLGTRAPSIGFEFGMLGVSAFFALASWAGICLLTYRTETAEVPERGTLIVRIAVIALPLLIVLALAIGSWATAPRQDAAGDIAEQVRLQPIATQSERALVRYDDFQLRLAVARALIAADGWETVTPYGYDPARRECVHEQSRCYGFVWTYRVEGVLDAEAVGAALDAAGWDAAVQGDRVEATGAEGISIAVTAADGRIEVSASSAWWWGDGNALRAELPQAEAGTLPAAVSSAEWPSLSR